MKGFDAGLEDKTLSPLGDGGADDSGDDDELTAAKVPNCGRRGPANFRRSGNDTDSGAVGIEAKRAMADRSSVTHDYLFYIIFLDCPGVFSSS